MDKIDKILFWFAVFVLVVGILLSASVAFADGEWYETETENGEWTLAIRGAKVLDIVANASPYERSMMLCIDKAKDPNGLAPMRCDAHDGRSLHFLFPEGFGRMVDLAEQAKENKDKINLHVNTDPASIGMIETAGGLPRCYVSRIAWLD